MPAFEPLRVGGGGARRLRRALWRRRHALAAGLAVTAAALAATSLGGGGMNGDATQGIGTGAGGTAGAAQERARRPAPLASAPVRIADAGTVRLLRPGDRVDVVAVGRQEDRDGIRDKDRDGSRGESLDGVRVLAKGALVADVPQRSAEGLAEDGALIVLSVPRSTAASLAGAGISTRLAVVLC
ncbi:RcpC/CpaB family pilus assembly protein [Streptomyces sp. CB01580]|uniref:RcpC/CpaB family pilus assembly protein n=1 Tax=Streptomyces sp. CB01580 TaxID=1703933 RepID=UPI001F5B130D|nr:RcpC/CpaB family pilus assembly protein [Streptomyces sp. CB01580]